MKVKCYKCRERAEGTEDELVDMGWQGAKGVFDTQHYSFAACADHSKDFVKEFPELLKQLRRR